MLPSPGAVSGAVRVVPGCGDHCDAVRTPTRGHRQAVLRRPAGRRGGRPDRRPADRLPRRADSHRLVRPAAGPHRPAGRRPDAVEAGAARGGLPAVAGIVAIAPVVPDVKTDQGKEAVARPRARSSTRRGARTSASTSVRAATAGCCSTTGSSAPGCRAGRAGVVADAVRLRQRHPRDPLRGRGAAAQQPGDHRRGRRARGRRLPVLRRATHRGGRSQPGHRRPGEEGLRRYDSGHLADNPRVDYVNADGRSYLARSDKKYDLVWFPHLDSYSATNASTSSAFVLSESYLYTSGAVKDSLDHLSPNGMIAAQFGEIDAERPNRTGALHQHRPRRAGAGRREGRATAHPRRHRSEPAVWSHRRGAARAQTSILVRRRRSPPVRSPGSRRPWARCRAASATCPASRPVRLT